MDDNHWLQLPDSKQYSYRLIKSVRAKYIRIKLSQSGELSVVLPRGIAERHAHNFIQKKSSWIVKNLRNISIVDNEVFPATLNLLLLNETWDIKYSPLDGAPNRHIVLTEVSSNQLEIIGNIKNWELVKKTLNDWCKYKAQDIFYKMLKILAEEHGFHFNRLTIRSQKTRWGSCSANKNISLNSKLLLMPKNVVSYVMIHELSHTIEMNHSSKFWKLVGDCDADYKANRKELKALGKYIVL